jgi:hypothetical protein
MLISFYPPPLPGLGRDAPGTASGYLRQQWIRGAWTRSGWGERFLFVIATLLWWPTTILHAAYLAARLGPSRARTSGKSPFRQFLEQIEVAAKWMVPPLWYYTFEFFDDERRAHAGDYIQRVAVKTFIYNWLFDHDRRRDPKTPFASKYYFFRLCQKHKLPEAGLIATVDWRRVTFVYGLMTEFPPIDLFIKIKIGRGGRAAEKWSYVGDGTYRNADGRSFKAAELARHLQRKCWLEKRLVQRCLVNHGALSDLNLDALATVRILTARNETGKIEATHAVFRMPQRRGAAVDNIHAGGIAAPVEMASGKLGRATDLGLKTTSQWHAQHPATGAQIEGRTLPYWPEAVALACRGHELIGDRVVVGWDIAILEDGPCFVEGNGKPDVDLIQRPHRAGLGASRLGEIMAFHLKNHLAGDLRNGRQVEELAKS